MIQLAVLGAGTVASGVCALLERNRAEIKNRIGQEVVIRKILARTPEKAYALGFSRESVVSSIEPIVNDPEISVVVELMGGTDDAYRYITRCMEAGKHIVTANKDLLALRWDELSALAHQNKVDLYFEASVCGGIPLITPIRQTLAANRVTSIMAILNGTTNYILSSMTRQGRSYKDALGDAQRLGYAEADPTADVGGADAARKITILSCLAFHSRVTLDDVYCEGITYIEPADIETAAQLGYVVKLIAYAAEKDGRILAFVRPAFVAKSHPIASVNDSFNAVYLTCDAADEVMLYGRGAGSDPTASSVVGDVMEVCRNSALGVHDRFMQSCYDRKPIAPIGSFYGKFFLRLHVYDRPGVFARIAAAMGDGQVSFQFIIQKPLSGGTSEIVIVTHPAYERDVRAALSALSRLDAVIGSKAMICLEGA